MSNSDKLIIASFIIGFCGGVVMCFGYIVIFVGLKL